ncbi:PQQ-dependent sugar dehydrogenase [Actinoplanes xinjiangensis]|uniref:Glucose/arabinose dehydrogenase n=1 Tax=Actinoplanes xinjiangensis TaxID=512350 RepID=A0A316EWB0_9ACTN|nr:PQQ-dependent sugar dehydrogenase [Actinoplanes xinjiangensis]PWK36125.1 glucose/arabinose dehydrogenase [Actinoplanes xinjiangensis]GIF42868.1 glucose dehydrogenase [Actinoplanes xinjiangensis]
MALVRRHRTLATVLAAGLVAGCNGGTPEAADVTTRPQSEGLAVATVVAGLEHPWDLGFLPDGRILLTERPARFRLVDGGTASEVRADLTDVSVGGEGGLMGLVVHPDFARTREFTTCQTRQEGRRPVDVRLVTWRLSPDAASATRVRDLLTGLPISTGRHSGCRPTIAADGALLVGTGDVARPSHPQDRRSLGGKVLRIDLRTGEGLPDNPFSSSADANERRVYSYGHRNVQGVAVRPGSGQVFTAEHGPSGFDEMNRIRPGGNYGWDPSRGGTVETYDESVPMTDRERFPDAVLPLWTSGQTSTEAPSGAAFITGSQWGPLNGRLAVVALRGQKTLLFQLDEAGDRVVDLALPTELNDAYGRLRGVRSGPGGALYITTSNGTDDRLLRITPPA